MEFPSYVPQGARDHAQHFLSHYEPSLERGRQELAEIEADIQAWSQRLKSLSPDDISSIAQARLSELRQRRKEQKDWNKQLDSDIGTIRRLIHDGRMKDAYRVLFDAFFEDEEIERNRKFDGFIYAAWAARINFNPHRENLKRARELKEEVAKAAENLAGLLRQIGETGENLPPEFYGVDYLLRATENTDDNGKDLYMWRMMRGTILGDPPRQPEPEPEEAPATEEPVLSIRFLEPGETPPPIDPATQARANARYGWGVAPPVAALLDTLVH